MYSPLLEKAADIGWFAVIDASIVPRAFMECNQWYVWASETPNFSTLFGFESYKSIAACASVNERYFQ